MSNNYFAFKKFTVHQEHCALKVCTDACLFGAWVAARSEILQPQNILDIGTGTGLLSLMLAQKTTAMIDAVEIDAHAAKQATANFADATWIERLKVHHTSIQAFEPDHFYDLIISNPPFFENDLKSVSNKRNLALHSAALSLEELLQFATDHLTAKGFFAVLLPFHRTAYFEELAIANFYLYDKLLVRQTPAHPYFRSMLLFGKSQGSTNEDEIIIRNDNQQYSEAFTHLLKDYYLYL